jgi:hypothetical protein
MKRFVAVTLAAFLCSASALAQPVVVELFTSQGCSSCPPADALLGELASRPGIVALAYHVDYWDDLGWKDRYSIPEAAQRQRGYVKRLSRSGAFTPQIVVSGDTSVVGSNRREVERAIAGDRDTLGLALSSAGGDLEIQFKEAWREPMDVYLVSYRARATDKIASGENARRPLVQAARELEREAAAHVRLDREPAAGCHRCGGDSAAKEPGRDCRGGDAVIAPLMSRIRAFETPGNEGEQA